MRYLISKTQRVLSLSMILIVLSYCSLLQAEALTENTIYPSGDYQVTEDIVVPAGMSLTIEAGAVLRFAANIKIQVNEGGLLFINGKNEAPILLTSITALPSSWQGIQVDGERATSADIQIDFATIEYAKYGVIYNQGAKGDISHSILRYNSVGIYFKGKRTGGNVSDCQIYDNNEGIYVYGDNAYEVDHPTPVVTNNSIYNNTTYNYKATDYAEQDKTVLNASHNWWGSTDIDEIKASIYELSDNYRNISVDFSAFLTAENGPVVSETILTSSVNQDTIWQSSNAILVQQIKVVNNATLTITEGTYISAIKSSRIIIEPGSKLIVSGTEQLPVTLTSTSQENSSWYGILVNGDRANSDDIQISHAVIEYAHYGLYFSVGAKADINHSDFRYNRYAFYYQGMNTGGRINTSSIHENTYGVYVSAASNSFESNPNLTINANSFYGNLVYNVFLTGFKDADKQILNASGNWWGTDEPSLIAASIYDNVETSAAPTVDYSGFLTGENGEVVTGDFLIKPITNNTTWSYTDAVLSQPIKVLSGATLTIAAGTTISAVSKSKITIYDGANLVIEGTELSPVIFSSETKSRGSWEGIVIEGERADNSTVDINYTVIEYAKYALELKANAKVKVNHTSLQNNTEGVRLRVGSQAEVINSIIRDNKYGLYYEKNTGGVVHYSQIYNNEYGVYIAPSYAYVEEHPTPIINFNSIYNNTRSNYTATLFKDVDATILDARNNWWGTDNVSSITTHIYDQIENTYSSPIVDFTSFLATENGLAVTETFIFTPVLEDTIWSYTDAIIAQPIRVDNNATLTIRGGTYLEAAANGQLIIEDGAKLLLQGGEKNPVTLTGQDKVRSSWKGIAVRGARSNNNDIQLNNAVIEYATEALYLDTGTKASLFQVTLQDNYSGVKLNTGSLVDISSSIIRNNYVGLYYNGKRTGGNVQQTQIYNNDYGIYVNAHSSYFIDHPTPKITQSSIYNNVNYNYYTQSFYDAEHRTLTATGNWWGTNDLTEIAASIYDYSDGTKKPQVDYRQLLTSENGEPLPGTHLLGSIKNEVRWKIDDGFVLSTTKIEDGGHLIIEAGSIIKFAPNSQIIVNKNAALTIVGAKEQPVRLTSAQAQPSERDWLGILVNAENKSTIISHAIIEYADKGLQVLGKKANAQITQSTIQHNNYGIYVRANNVSIDDEPSVIVSNNILKNNLLYSFYADSFKSQDQRILNARGNYWGSFNEVEIANSVYDFNDFTWSPLIDTGFARTNELALITAQTKNVLTFSTELTPLTAIVESTSDINQHSWLQYLGDSVELLNANTGQASFIAPEVSNDKVLKFIYTVSDTNDIYTTDKLDVVVKPLSAYNQAPIVEDSRVVLVKSGANVEVSYSATDSDGDTLTYTWQQLSGTPISLSTYNTESLAFIAPITTQDSVYRFQLMVNDGTYSVERTVLIAVEGAEGNSGNEGGIFYYHNDHLGTPQVMTNESADIVWRANYTPFGKADVMVETVTNNIRFPGQYYDQESGLHYNYFRDYDPELGRYIQSDPIGLAGGINTYGYVGGNPINFIDPLGLIRWEGTYRIRSAVGGVGGVIGEFDLKSECADGFQATAKVLFTGPAGGVGIKLAEVNGRVAFEDHQQDVNVNVFNGVGAIASAGFQIFSVGRSVGDITLGNAYQRPVDGDSESFGLDFGALVSLGSSTITDSTYSYGKCSCE